MKRSGTCHNFSRDYAVWPGSGQKRLPSSRLFSDAGLATRPLISHLSLLTAYCLLLTAYRLPLTAHCFHSAATWPAPFLAGRASQMTPIRITNIQVEPQATSLVANT